MKDNALTNYHSKYFACELTKKCSSDSDERFAGTMVDAQVDLNPHQIDAALFAFHSPLSRGAILADEVGLGKTIEAGLLISQKWAEYKRKILIITPASLRKQWYQEIMEKFFIPCEILETKSYNSERRKGNLRPFLKDNTINICSYHFAKSKASDIASIPWDLVVFDEAHRLRNVYKPTNIMANTLKQALMSAPKLLLTATPLQNSLLELYGLVSIIDDHIFGDLRTYKEHYTYLDEENTFTELKLRLKPVCHRTLRRQVEPYIKYTRRHAILQEFTPEDNEDKLYNSVSEFLRRDNLMSLPSSQRSLIILVMRKLMASSSYAIAGALETIIKRLKDRIRNTLITTKLTEDIAKDYDCFEEDAEEMENGNNQDELSPQDIKSLQEEILELSKLKELATSIEFNAKGKALLLALEKAFARAETLGAPRKAIIFTESRKTQDYILRVLSETPYKDNIVLFNGSNNDERSKEIYHKWLKKYSGTDKITGSKTADMRNAIVDYFEDEGIIMIATEAGAEGINLQFCSLVVNYDLPWNPQRIEQRIGRCHRYGQKFDVVVVNFLNNKNAADQRVYELLNDKFRLFEGIFGASDEVLGAIESGVDLEKRIVDIYQNCRKEEEINRAFDELQSELMELIDEKVTQSRQLLLENFDQEVRDKLKIRENKSNYLLNKYEQLLMKLTEYELKEYCQFKDSSSFLLKENPFPEENIPTGLYELPRRTGEAFLYRLSHKLAIKLIDQAKERQLPPAEIEFCYNSSSGRNYALEQFLNKEGLLSLTLLTVESFDQIEEYIVFSAATNESEVIFPDEIPKLFNFPAKVIRELTKEDIMKYPVYPDVGKKTTEQIELIKHEISKRNAQFFDAEAQKIESWSDDLKNGLEYEIKELDKKMKEVRKSARIALSLEEKLQYQKELSTLEKSRNAKRKALFDEQDKIDAQRENLIQEIENKLNQNIIQTNQFEIIWRLYERPG